MLDWGDVPTWLSAVSSLLALAFAAVAVIIARRTFDIESRRDQATADDRRAQHARERRALSAVVSAWWGETTDPTAGTRRGALVRNGSGSPVYHAYLTVHPSVGALDQGPLKVRLPVIPPAEEATFHPVADQVGPGGTVHTADRQVSLTFTDAAGVRWWRDRHGLLRELPSELLVWGSDRLEAMLTAFASDFHAMYGARVRCDSDEWIGRYDRYVAASAAGTIADVLDAPHDVLGRLVGADLIEPVVLTAEHRASFTPSALEALTYEGKLYGVPLTVNCPVLIRNLELAPSAPATLEQALDQGEALVRSGRATHPLAIGLGPVGAAFNLSPVFTSAGGELFDRGPGAVWNPAVVLADSSSTVGAFRRLRDLGPVGRNVLRPELDEDGARQLFLDGATPFLLGLSADLSDVRGGGLRCGVSPFPPFAHGRPATPFVSVHGFFIARAGANKVLAGDLVCDYLTRPDVARRLAELASPSCLANVPDPDPSLGAFRGHPGPAVPMPAFPYMERVWGALMDAQLAAITDTTDPAVIAHDLGARLRTITTDHT